MWIAWVRLMSVLGPVVGIVALMRMLRLVMKVCGLAEAFSDVVVVIVVAVFFYWKG